MNQGYPGLIDNILDTRQGDRMDAESAFVLSSWFRRCVEVRADALAGIPFTIRDKQTNEVIYDSTGFLPMPDRLNWLVDIEAMLRLTEAALLLEGAAYWVKQINRGRYLGVDWVSPTLMEPKYNDTGTIIGYERTRYVPEGGVFVPSKDTISPRFIVPFFYRDPYTEVGPGNPIAAAARVNADVLYSLDQFLDSYMDRGLLPATIIAVPANTPPEERNRFQQWWDRYYRGKNRGGTQKVLNADAVKVEKIGDGIGQLGASDVVKQQREAILAATGVQMSHILPSGGGGRQGAQDDENLYTKAVIPSAKRIAVDLNRHLMDELGLFFRFEFKRIEALQRANLETARTVQRLVEKPVLTQNEGRALLGYEESDEEGADDLEAADSRLSNEASTLAVQESTSDPNLRPNQAPPENTRRAVGIEILEELGAWKKKVKNKGRDCDFECRVIPPGIEAEVRSRLSLPDEAEPLEKVFEPPFVRL